MNPTRLLTPAIVLALFAIALPVRLLQSVSGPSNEACLTLPDRVPGAAVAPVVPVMPGTPVTPVTIDTLERCSSLYPGDVELMADLGAAYESAATPARAEAVYRQALAVDPDYADLRLRLGRLLLGRGAPADARREADLALRVQPNRRALLDLRRDAEAALAETRP